MRAEYAVARYLRVVIDHYLSGIARCAWPEADVTYTQQRRRTASTGSRGTAYTLWKSGIGDGTGRTFGLGIKFRDAKATLRRLVERAPITTEP